MLYTFEDFELDTDAAELRRAGSVVPLQPQVFALLSYLVGHAGRMARKDELLAAVWGTTFVSDSALTTRLKEARKALSDDGSSQRLIKTIRGRGYRFDAPTEQSRQPREVSARMSIRFCTASDGVAIAFTTTGNGPPLVKAANWLSHLEYDEQSPVWRHLIAALSEDFTVVRYDERGSGLSDRELDDDSFTIDAWVRDLETVADAAGLQRFPLLGISQGGPVAISYAVLHPERVSHLILHGSYARGRNSRSAADAEIARALAVLAAEGWGNQRSSFAQLFATRMLPEATPEQARWLVELQRVSASPQNAALFRQGFAAINVDSLLERVKAPTLVLHCERDQMVPFEEGRHLAAAIPNARFQSLNSENHLLLETEPAWTEMIGAIRSFLRENTASNEH